MTSTSITSRRTASFQPRAFIVPVVRELPRPAADHIAFSTTW
jgi:hypothetical protein